MEIYSLIVQKSSTLKSRCQQSHILSEVSKGGSFFSSPIFWWPMAVLGIPWLVDTSLQSLPPLSQGVLPVCTSVSKFPSSYRTPIVLAAPSTPVWLQQLCFQIRSHSTVLEVRTSTYDFVCVGRGEWHNSTPNRR